MGIGINLKNLRTAKGMTQKDLAEALNVSSQAVSRWENEEVEPDLTAISKIASIFDVSVDELINSKKFEKKINKYRNVFVSGKRFDCMRHADMDHGLEENAKKINDELAIKRQDEYRLFIKNNNYSKVLHLQYDSNACIFIDEKKKTFGLIFDSEEHFICPFENFVNIAFSDNGNTTAYVDAPFVGVGVGKTNSLAVGSLPLAQNNMPDFYNVIITYFDNTEHIQTYQFRLCCLRNYVFKDKTVRSVDFYYFWKNGLSSETLKSLNVIKSNFEAIKEISKTILSGEVEVPELTFSDRKTYDPKEELMEIMKRNEKYDERDFMIKVGKIILSIVLVGLVIGLLIYFLKKI